MRLQWLDQHGTVAILFAVAAMPIALGVAAAVDFASLAAGRAALQRAADNAALSGAASYIADTMTLNQVAVSTARSTFCNATTTLPNGFTINAPSDGTTCGVAKGADVSAGINGYRTGTPDIASGSGCSSSQTVVLGGYTCGFTVKVTATATTNLTFAGLLGGSHTLSVTATAVNPFINLGDALVATLQGTAWNANSVWVYPLLLNAEGQPDFSPTNPGALPAASECTGDPIQTWCGSYSMVASTKYFSCKAANPCTVDGTTFGGSGGIVQNIHASSAVITATTPLGIAFQSAAGGYQGPGVDYNKYDYLRDSNNNIIRAENGCTWPAIVAWNTIPQTYDKDHKPLIIIPKRDSLNNIVKDSLGNNVYKWVYPTHWFYSSYLVSNLPPSQQVIDMQNNWSINPDTGYPFRSQLIRSVPEVKNGANNPATCTDAAALTTPSKTLVTNFPSAGNSNCSLYIVKDPANPTNLVPNSSYVGKCFSPDATSGSLNATPSKQYASLSCQNYGRSNYAFFWNDMGGKLNGDDKNYNNGTLLVNCSAVPKIILIN